MAVDLKQFHQVFIEESVEGLDAMESALMDLDVDGIDNEIINTIFRSAHSIKGGAGTFGFSALASFTHVLETLLDEVRAGDRTINVDVVNLLLKSVDCMRDMLDLIQQERNEYTADATDIQAALERVLGNKKGDPALETNTLVTDDPMATSNAGWQVTFKPHLHIISTGNDPLRIIKELVALADSAEVNIVGEVPSLTNYCSENCYFSWVITLQGSAIAESSIREAFEWVIEECELTIKPIVAGCENGAIAVGGIHSSDWKIHFSPYPHLFQTGNDPLKILTDLATACSVVQCNAIVQGLPSFKLMDAEKCYLAWDIYVSNVEHKSDIEHVFEWVIGEGDIVFEHWNGALPQNLPVDDAVAVANTLKAAQPKASVQPLVSPTAKPQEVYSAEPVAAKKSESGAAKKKAQPAESSSIRVGIDKIDSLINMVGELVITQSMLGQLGNDFNIQNLPRLIEGLNQLEQNTRELQESVMRIRMLPISFAFSRFPRMVRDLGQTLNKKINLVLLGENTELDKTVMEKIGDPLVHLVRNSVDHGIETSAERIAAGKAEEGKVTLNAYHQGGNVVIEISDDGRGLDRVKLADKGVERGLIQASDVATLSDEQIYDLIFQPGFSTAQQVSDLSGRGVGMDVVKRNIQALNGVVEIQSKKGSGTKIRISLPLTLAILDGQLVRVGDVTYIFPLVSIVESMQYREELISHIAGGCSVFKLREEYVPIVDLGFVFGQQTIAQKQHSLMVVVESDGCKVAMLVDELLAQQQVVIKSLEQNYKRIEGVSGATILGDGTVALIIDVPGVIRLAGAEQLTQQKILRKTA